MMSGGEYDFDGCVRLLGAVIRQEIRDAYAFNDPARLRRAAEWLDMTPAELRALWERRRNSHSETYGIVRSDSNGKQ